MQEAVGVVANEDRVRLKAFAASTNAGLSRRARIVLLAVSGQSDAQIARTLGISRKTAWRWRTRFAQGGIEAIETERPRSGRKPKLRDKVARLIIETTLTVQPENGSCWSTRRLAEVLGVSRGMVHRVWRDHGLGPQRRQPPAESG